MRRIIVVLVALIIIGLTSCGYKIVPLKGDYPQTPIVFKSDKSFDKVWDNIIDLFAQTGVPIHLVDRSSGLIISGVTNIPWSFENKSGDLINKSAYIALVKYIDKGNNKPVKPFEITGKWNIRIKDIGEGRTSVNINLHELSGSGDQFNAAIRNKKTRSFSINGKTTGNFEKLIFDIIK